MYIPYVCAVMLVLQLSCVCAAAVCPRPVVLRHSLPTYVHSYASPCTATATTDVLHSVPSSTMLGSTVPSVLWSPGSTNTTTMVTQVAGVNSSVSHGIHKMTAASSDVTSPMSRARTFSDCSHSHPRHTVQPVLTSASSGSSLLSGSQQQTDRFSFASVEDLASQLVASLPADIVKSLVESDSSQQTAEMLLETLNVIHGGSVGRLDAGVVQKLYNSPQLANVVKELFCSSRFEAEMTEQDIGSWKSLAGLLQQTDNKTVAFSGPQDFSHSELHVPGCEAVMRSLGQLGHAPAHQLEDQASNLHWYVFCRQLHVVLACELLSQLYPE